jgi:hypothetical protein
MALYVGEEHSMGALRIILSLALAVTLAGCYFYAGPNGIGSGIGRPPNYGYGGGYNNQPYNGNGGGYYGRPYRNYGYGGGYYGQPEYGGGYYGGGYSGG